MLEFFARLYKQNTIPYVESLVPIFVNYLVLASLLLTLSPSPSLALSPSLCVSFSSHVRDCIIKYSQHPQRRAHDIQIGICFFDDMLEHGQVLLLLNFCHSYSYSYSLSIPLFS